MADRVLPVDVSRETLDRLVILEELTKQWTTKINLIAKGTLSDLWQRHIADSAQLIPLLPSNVQHYADLGSGGGFPGLVIAAALAETSPGARISFVESDARKGVFLRQAARKMGLSIQVLTARIEQVEPLGADLMTARALAPLSALLGHAERHLVPNGVALFPKGRQAAKEVEEAREGFRFDLTRTTSQTDGQACILRLENITRA